MLNRLFETLLISILNCVLPAVRSRLAGRKPQPTNPSDDQVLIGQTIPSLPQQKTETVHLDPAARRRHLYVLGATGTGKTNLIMRLLESDIAAKRSFCVVDLRGDLVDRVLLRLAAAGDPEAVAKRLVLIDLRSENHVVGFNPLSGSGDVYSRAFHILSVLKHQSDSWGIQLEETLRNCLLALAETGWSLLEIEPLLSNPGFRAEVLGQVTDTYVQSFFERYDALSGDKQTAWSLPVLNKVTPLLAIPQLRLLFGQRQCVSLRELLDREPGRIILVSLAVDRLHHAAHLVGGLFISAFQSAIMARVDTPEKDRVPVSLYIDEFETMASDRFEAIVAEGRRFGLGLTLSHQNLSQLPNVLRDLLRNNVHTQFYFQTGAVDAAELVAEIASSEPRETVRKTLITQGVGQAFLIRRGSPSCRIQVAHAPDPKVGPKAVHALCAASWQVFGVPSNDARRELQERWDRLAALKALAPLPAASRGRGSKAVPRIRKDPEAISAPVHSEQAADPDPIAGEMSGALAAAEIPSPSASPVVPAKPESNTKTTQSAVPDTTPKPAFEVRHAKTPGKFRPKETKD